MRQSMTGVLAVLLALLAGLVAPTGRADAAPKWRPKSAPLTTPWTSLVGPENALPDYPRPQMVRSKWQNLNGVWDYLGRSGSPILTSPPARSAYSERVLVPYPVEAALSGIGRHDDEMWYRKSVEIPSDWDGQRILLHFGAADQVATVWVNGQQVAHHEGGYTEFSADVTAALRRRGSQEVVARVQDRNEASPFPLGKQRNRPGGLFYTGASGIWQTVWMEPVPAAHIEKLSITTDLESATFMVRAPGAAGEQAVVFVSDPRSGVVAIAAGATGKPIRLSIPNPHLWTPEKPFLYAVQVALVDPSGRVVDAVSSYTGLRTVGAVRDRQGHTRIAINGKATFLHGPLDQGYWPDGIYTAPTDAALKFDVERIKDLGMNFVRKHAKVEPARWYYWADRIGLLVWQDMPSLDVSLRNPVGPAPEPPPVAQAAFEHELLAMIDQLRSVTSIVGWVPFNEGWGEFDTARIAELVKAADPTRMVNANSGVNCCKTHGDTGAGDVFDDHTYVGPGRPSASKTGARLAANGRRPDDRVLVDGEYGGLGLTIDRNRWPGRPESYEMTNSQAQLTRRYVEVSRALEEIVQRGGLAGAIYTQITDVENEVNGLMTYDRRLVKVAISAVAQRNRMVIAAGTPGAG